MQYIIVADGACSGNPGPGGWAYEIHEDHPEQGALTRSSAGNDPHTTNNIMELSAAIAALADIANDPTGPVPGQILMHLDSRYVLDGMFDYMPRWKANGWRTAAKKPVKNQEKWEEMDALMAALKSAGFTFSKSWVKGHDGDTANERVDARAVEMRDKASGEVKPTGPVPATPAYEDYDRAADDLGETLTAALDGDIDTRLKAILDEYAEGLLTVKGARKKLAALADRLA